MKRTLSAVLTAVGVALAGCASVPGVKAPVASVVPSTSAVPVEAKKYQVGEHLGFLRADTFHVEVRPVCDSNSVRTFLAKEGKYQLSKLAKQGAFKMPRESLSLTVVVDGLVKAVNYGDEVYQLVDRDNLYERSLKPSSATATGLTFEGIKSKDPAFAIRMPYASFDKGARQVARFVPVGWKLAGGASSVEFDFSDRLAMRRVAMLQILLVDSRHPACN